MIATALWGCVYLVCTHVYSGGFITSEFSYYIYFSIRHFWPLPSLIDFAITLYKFDPVLWNRGAIFLKLTKNKSAIYFAGNNGR